MVHDRRQGLVGGRVAWFLPVVRPGSTVIRESSPTFQLTGRTGTTLLGFATSNSPSEKRLLGEAS